MSLHQVLVLVKLTLTPTLSTPKALDEALPNSERGIFHIQNAQYWAFYNLEYDIPFPSQLLLL